MTDAGIGSKKALLPLAKRHGDRTEEQRHELGQLLRSVRRTSNRTLIALASDTGIHFNRLSRIERGDAKLRQDELLMILSVIDAPADVRLRMTQLTEEVHDEPVIWQLPDSLEFRTVDERQREVTAMLDECTQVKGFFPTRVPSHLRTREYARHSAEQSLRPLGASPAEIASVCAAKSFSQEMLYDTGRQFEIVLHEAAFFVTPAPTDVMVMQAEKVAQLSRLKNVEIGIVPLGTPMTFPAVHDFFLFNDTVLHLELAVGHIEILAPRYVALYRRLFNMLNEDALFGDAARERLENIAHVLDENMTADTRSASRR